MRKIQTKLRLQKLTHRDMYRGTLLNTFHFHSYMRQECNSNYVSYRAFVGTIYHLVQLRTAIHHPLYNRELTCGIQLDKLLFL